MTTPMNRCSGCGTPTDGMCWTDCGMSLCGAPLCGGCQHVDEKYGFRHKPLPKPNATPETETDA